MNELQELYNNASSYTERFGYNSSIEWKDLSEKITDLIEEISSILDDKQREKLEELKSLCIKQTGLEIDRMFFFAFKCGATLIMDIKNE